MKKVYLLCALTLAAVVGDIVFFHTRTARAQNVPSVRIDRIYWGPGINSTTVPALGHIVGFHCVAGVAVPECFVLSSAN